MKKQYNNRLFIKIFILIFLGIFIIFFIFGIFSFFEKKHILLESLRVEAMNMAKSISLVSSDALVLDDNAFLVELTFNYIKKEKRVKSIIVAKKDLTYLVVENNHWNFSNTIDDKIKIKQKISESYGIEMSPLLKEEVFSYTYPIYLSGLQWGWIHISLDTNEYNKNIENLYIIYFYLLIGTVFISLFCSFMIARTFSKPIIALNNVAKEISEGNLSKRVEIKRNDEIGELANTFNDMLDNLEKSKNALIQSNNKLESRVKKRTDELRNTNIKLKSLNDNLDVRIKIEINKRKEQEEILIQQSRLAAMGEMISMIAHQWRQPLNAIGLIIQNLHFKYNMNSLDKTDMDEGMKKSFALITKMSNTIDDFRDFFKPDKIEKEFSIHHVISEIINLVEVDYDTHNIRIELEQGDVTVYALENEFLQVLLNILSNAKDALLENSIENPYIHIKIEKNNNNAEIYIRDNAGGIDTKIINKIFEPYFSTKNEKNGTGIGLYMSKIIIEQNMNGNLDVQNIDNGAQFCIVLPISSYLS